VTHPPQIRAMRAMLSRILRDAHAVRDLRPYDWHRYEMDELLSAINFERAKLRKASIDMRELLAIESSAAGHVDYASKLALYAADLVYAPDDKLAYPPQ
jgi:hypothetical protein